MALIGDENQVKAAEDDGRPTYPFDYECGAGFFVPVHILLDKFGACSRQDDNGTMT